MIVLLFMHIMNILPIARKQLCSNSMEKIIFDEFNACTYAITVAQIAILTIQGTRVCGMCMSAAIVSQDC